MTIQMARCWQVLGGKDSTQVVLPSGLVHKTQPDGFVNVAPVKAVMAMPKLTVTFLGVALGLGHVGSLSAARSKGLVDVARDDTTLVLVLGQHQTTRHHERTSDNTNRWKSWLCEWA